MALSGVFNLDKPINSNNEYFVVARFAAKHEANIAYTV